MKYKQTLDIADLFVGRRLSTCPGQAALSIGQRLAQTVLPAVRLDLDKWTLALIADAFVQAGQQPLSSATFADLMDDLYSWGSKGFRLYVDTTPTPPDLATLED